jgi:glycosyltransferase involved in cell wall biosynthesis
MTILEIVIPCFNEEENIPRLIESLNHVGDLCDISFILVDNGSLDNTRKVIEQHLSKRIRGVFLTKNLGYGGGILAGLQESNGDYVGWMHADLQTDPACLVEFVPNLNSKTLLKGKRFGRSIADQLFTFGMSIFETLTFRRLLWDINGQPTIACREWILGLANPPNDFSFDLYIYVNARLSGFTVERTSVFFGPRFRGVSSWNVGFRSRLRFVMRTISYTVSLRRGFNEDL